MQKLRPGLWGWRAPVLAARGNPSRGEMRRLLTREIKSGRDGEYLYDHLLTRREDASSQGSAAKLHFSRLLSSESLLFGQPGGKYGLHWDTHSPQEHHHPQSQTGCCPAPKRGGARKTSPELPQLTLASPLVASLWGEEQNLTFSSLGLIFLSKAPALSRGWTWEAGVMAARRRSQVDGAPTTVESQALSSLNLLTMASLIFNNPHHLRLFLSCERFRLSTDFFSLQNLFDSMYIDFNHDLKT